MLFKASLKNQGWTVPDTMSDESDEFIVEEQLEGIPPEWDDQWWKEKIALPVRPEVLALFPSMKK